MADSPLPELENPPNYAAAPKGQFRKFTNVIVMAPSLETSSAPAAESPS
jgi:hypothetical protein